MRHSNHDTAALMLRSSLGVILTAHGLLNVFVFTLPGTIQYFASLGLPALTAYPTAFAEIGLGAALIAGILARFSAGLSIPILVGASWVHINNEWLFGNEGGGWKFPVLLGILAIIVLIQGAGNHTLIKFFQSTKHR